MCRRCASSAWWVFALVLALGMGRASAQPAPVSPQPAATETAPAPAATKSEAEAASDGASLSLKEATDRGIRLFQQGDYEGAIAAFSAAYVLSPKPMFLFNIAQAHRKAGHLDEALLNYQLFLRKAPDSPLRPETEAYIELVRMQKLQPRAPTPPSPPPAALPPPPVAPALTTAPTPVRDAPPSRPAYQRPWVWATVGAAVAVASGIAVGVYFGTRPPQPTLGYAEPTF